MYLDQISCLVTCLCFTRYSFESHAIFFSSDILKSLDFFFTKSIGFLLKYHRNLSKIRDRSLIMAWGSIRTLIFLFQNFIFSIFS